MIIDATRSQYIDFDVLELIREFHEQKAPQKNIHCVLTGFKEKYRIANTKNVQLEKAERAFVGTNNVKELQTI